MTKYLLMAGLVAAVLYFCSPDSNPPVTEHQILVLQKEANRRAIIPFAIVDGNIYSYTNDTHRVQVWDANAR